MRKRTVWSSPGRCASIECLDLDMIMVMRLTKNPFNSHNTSFQLKQPGASEREDFLKQKYPVKRALPISGGKLKEVPKKCWSVKQFCLFMHRLHRSWHLIYRAEWPLVHYNSQWTLLAGSTAVRRDSHTHKHRNANEISLTSVSSC